MEEEIEEESEYNPYKDDNIFSINYKKVCTLIKSDECLTNDCRKDIEVYDVSFVYSYPTHKFKSYEVGIRTPVHLHAALWRELLKACKLMEFTEEEFFREDNYIKYMTRLQFDVPNNPEKRVQLFSGLKKLKDTIRHMLDHVPTIVYIGQSIQNIDMF